MSQSNPITSFGIHQATVKDLVTHEMFTMLVLDSAEPDFTQDLVDLRGGSSAFPWGSAPGEASGEISLTVKQYDAGVLKYFSPYASGAISEELAGDASGNITTPVEVVGTSIMSATTGIATIAVDTATKTDLKFGDYVIVAASATTINVYVNTNIDGFTYEDDALKVNATPITIPGTGADVVWNGIKFTGGSGSIAFTTGDKATFSVRPVNSYSMLHYLGKQGSSPLEFELTLVGEKIGNKIRVARFPRCISGGGAGLKFLYKDWASFDTTIKLLQDAQAGYVGVESVINR